MSHLRRTMASNPPSHVPCSTVVALLALLALANGANAQQLRPPFFQAHGIHHLFGWHHALQERHVENIQRFDLFPRRLNDLRTGIEKKIKKALPDFFKKAEAEVRPRGLPWFPRLPTIPKIPHIPKTIDKPNLIRGYRHMGIYPDNSEKSFANIPTSSESDGRPHIERPKSVLHKLGKLSSKIDNLSTNKVDVATSPSPLPPEDSYLCNLDYSGINKYPGKLTYSSVLLQTEICIESSIYQYRLFLTMIAYSLLSLNNIITW